MANEADEAAIVAMLERGGADWSMADCAPPAVARLREMDHHVVVVDGRAGILITYHLWTEPPPPRPRVYVLFHYADRHPRAPDDVQRLVAALRFARP